MPAKSAQTKPARRASVSGERAHPNRGRNSRSGVRNASFSKEFVHAKSAPPARSKSETCKKVRPPEWEDDEFDRALAKALDAGAFDEMIAKALQDERDGKTFPL